MVYYGLIILSGIILIVITDFIEQWFLKIVAVNAKKRMKIEQEEKIRIKNFVDLKKYLFSLGFNILSCGGYEPIRIYGWLPGRIQFYFCCSGSTCYLVLDDKNDPRQVKRPDAGSLSEKDTALTFADLLEQYEYTDLANQIRRVY